MPTPPGNRFAAHAPVVRIHLVDDDDRGSRIFPQDAHKQFRRPLDEFRFLLGGRRAVFPRHPDIDVRHEWQYRTGWALCGVWKQAVCLTAKRHEPFRHF